MKKCSLIFGLFYSLINLQAQVSLPKYPDSLFSTYYHQRVTLFKSLPQTTGDLIFIGNSITDGGEWSELFKDLRIKNRGISGDVSAGLVNRINEISQRKPSKVFLMIGINDLARNISPDSLVKNILLIATWLKQEAPSTQLFVQSLLPVTDHFGKFASHTGKYKQIQEVNEQLKQKAVEYSYQFVDLNNFLSDKSGKLREELTNDGLHLNGNGYLLWKHKISPFVYGLQQQISLLPKPREMEIKTSLFPLYLCRNIFITDTALRKEGLVLQKEFQAMGIDLSIINKESEKDGHVIELKLGLVEAPAMKEEAYRLEVNDTKVLLTANTPHGIFNGVQTLLQMAVTGVFIEGCSIRDWPAFSWRGYMMDVGRNYMTMESLKEQIDVMAKYKLNVFHFHPTEDIAWRIAIKQYPQLTAPEHMLRNKGLYYSEKEIKELIAYCRERHIVFLPEIDMPGHSAAFSRAMKTNMQSDTGVRIVKNILKEFCESFDVPFIHIGADEVKITNKIFIPEITAYIESFGKRVIGWQPGGNFSNKTIRQLWMDDNGHASSNATIQFIDSRHLYVNHMDPLESAVTIFNRQIGNKTKGDNTTLGGTLCVWHDRAVANEADVLQMNPVYPGMLAFAERSWLGGGKAGWIANISDGDKDAFALFERRLLDHKKLFFKNKPFPYQEQSSLQWQLFGPFDNGGDLHKKFAPEKIADSNRLKPVKQEVGGTVVLHHWWYPQIKGAIDFSPDSSTWYATTKIWSDERAIKNFWIGFSNLSRSTATNSLPVNSWDNKGSAVWVNNNLIPSPQWKRGGQTGHSEIPLSDEGYEYRESTKILLQKGWNKVLIKAPVGSFKGTDWQNPVKWMFTFVPVTE
ncbi:MAG: family 20 glycosylhydrolase [Bacteroidota bacterium]